MTEHGGDIYSDQGGQNEQWLDFSANINPFGVPDSVKRAIGKQLDDICHYPDVQCRMLRDALSLFHGIPAESIVCGNGGADLIYRYMQALSPKRVLIPMPAFSEYGKAAEAVGAEVTYWKMPYPFRLTEQLLEVLRENQYDCLVLCNPNNPTGAVLDAELLESILHWTEQNGTHVLLDECFLDMADEAAKRSVISQLHRLHHVFVLKSMTKLYALAGLRLGYGICADVQLTEQVRRTGQPWPVNTLASAAGCAAIGDNGYRTHFLQFLRTERAFLAEQLRKIGFTVWESHANFVFFRAEKWQELDVLLRPYGILLRHCDSYIGLDRTYYRAAVRTRAENEALLHALCSVTKHLSSDSERR